MQRPSFKRKPAFAKDLVEARVAGQHPLSIDVIVGYHWDARLVRAIWNDRALYVKHQNDPGKLYHPRVAVRPPDAGVVPHRYEWRPGQIDWSCVAGVPVTIVDRTPYRPSGPFTSWVAYAIGGEIAHFAANVYIKFEGIDEEEWLLATAFVCKQGRKWPGWWSAELDERAHRNRERWISEVVRYYCGGVEVAA